MKKFQSLFIALLFVLAGALYSCSGDNSNAGEGDSAVVEETTVVDENNVSEDTTEVSNTEIAKYICPMHCVGSDSDKPGKCPTCGMDLIENPDYQE